jgi:hypothetical protein
MAKKAAFVRAFFRGVARVGGTFSIEVGPIRATGVPAILVGVTGIVVGAGIAKLLARAADRLPETLAEARGLAETLRGDRPRLNA